MDRSGAGRAKYLKSVSIFCLIVHAIAKDGIRMPFFRQLHSYSER
ncbi:RAxF-45 family protein [Bacillus carboniphilus]|uniref:RAxF-45 family protein n=1 Tax=Bacillus carboniphilus TaxID=86663 RepID=A0ABY9JQ61_9BACI|nr:RAxF-45 family protein [Bacillus carboniphilus]WLR41516.1 RAxF-45 family protein [Bacillus carboniphilus]